LNSKMRFLKAAWQSTPKAPAGLQTQFLTIEKQLTALSTALYGDRTLARREFETLPSISERVGRIQGNLVSTSAVPTQTMLTSYQTVAKQFTAFLTDLRKTQTDIIALETALQSAGAPHTPGRFPDWKEN